MIKMFRQPFRVLTALALTALPVIAAAVAIPDAEATVCSVTVPSTACPPPVQTILVGSQLRSIYLQPVSNRAGTVTVTSTVTIYETIALATHKVISAEAVATYLGINFQPLTAANVTVSVQLRKGPTLVLSTPPTPLSMAAEAFSSSHGRTELTVNTYLLPNQAIGLDGFAAVDLFTNPT